MADSHLRRLRDICLSLPETHEELTWEDHPTFRVRKKIFVIVAGDAGSMTLKADPEERLALLDDADRFYYPAYVGSKGWIGMYLKGRMDWDEVRELVTTSYCLIAPKTLAAQAARP